MAQENKPTLVKTWIYLRDHNIWSKVLAWSIYTLIGLSCAFIYSLLKNIQYLETLYSIYHINLKLGWLITAIFFYGIIKILISVFKPTKIIDNVKKSDEPEYKGDLFWGVYITWDWEKNYDSKKFYIGPDSYSFVCPNKECRRNLSPNYAPTYINLICSGCNFKSTHCLDFDRFDNRNKKSLFLGELEQQILSKHRINLHNIIDPNT